MSISEDMEETSSKEEDDEESNICLMGDTDSENSEKEQDEDEVDFSNLSYLQEAYQEFFSNSSLHSKAYESLKKFFQN